jgi:hypothetical protein
MQIPRLTSAVAISVLFLTSTALADDRINSLKKMNTDMCIQIGSNVPDAPKDSKLSGPYCQCVSDGYWGSVPKAEQDELLTKGSSPGIQKNMDARMAVAQAACKKKIGF